MTKLLLSLFVRNQENYQDTAVRSAVGALSGGVGIGCNTLLFLCKLIGGILTGSLAITADAMNNLSDASGSIVTLVGFKLAGKPADANHPYGHARLEYLSGLGVAVLILFIGLELAKSSVIRILRPVAVSFSPLAMGILLLSIGLKLWMWHFNRKLAGLIDSAAIRATAADSRNDCLATTAVLISALLGRVTEMSVDGIMGLGVAVFILYSGFTMAKQTVSLLLGESPDPELRQKLVDYIRTQPRVLGYHDLMVHDYGPGKRFASIHVEMDRNEDPLVCHSLIDEMERQCLRTHQVHLVIHLDPVVTDDPVQNRLHHMVTAILRVRHEGLSVHDFRRIGQKLVFDVTMPSQLLGKEEEICRALEIALAEMGEPDWILDVTFDPEG